MRYKPLIKQRGHIYEKCIRSVLLYGCETMTAKAEDMFRIVGYKNASPCWVCSKKAGYIAITLLRFLLKLHNIDETNKRVWTH